MKTSREVIRELGGHQALSEALGEGWKTVHNWTRPGRKIPSTVWLHIARLPQAAEIGLTVELLASLPANPTSRRRSA